MPQAEGQLTGGEELQPGCGELQRQRQSVESRADLDERGTIVRRHLEPRLEPSDALHQHLDRRRGGEAAEVVVLTRQPERTQRNLAFRAQVQPLPARRQHAEPGAPAQRRCGGETGVEHVLPVVDQEEQVLVDQRPAELLGRLGQVDVVDADGGQHRRGYQGRVPDLGEVDERHAVDVVRRSGRRRSGGQPRLADARRAGHRDHTPGRVLEEPPDRQQLVVPPHQRARRCRERSTGPSPCPAHSGPMSRTGSGPVPRRSPRTAPLVRRWQIARPLDEFLPINHLPRDPVHPVRRRRSAKIVPLTPYGFSPIAAEKHSGPTSTRMSRRLWMSLSAITRSAPRGRRSEPLSLRPARHGGKPPERPTPP